MLMQKAFLPSMPDDMQAAAREALGHLQWYRKSATLKHVHINIRFTHF